MYTICNRLIFIFVIKYAIESRASIYIDTHNTYKVYTKVNVHITKYKCIKFINT